MWFYSIPPLGFVCTLRQADESESAADLIGTEDPYRFLFKARAIARLRCVLGAWEYSVELTMRSVWGTPPPKRLSDHWAIGQAPSGRIYYLNHQSKTTHWIRPCGVPPPKEGVYLQLPDGWEFRPHPKAYFLDHNTKTTHNCDPRPVPSGWEQRYSNCGPFFSCGLFGARFSVHSSVY